MQANPVLPVHKVSNIGLTQSIQEQHPRLHIHKAYNYEKLEKVFRHMLERATWGFFCHTDGHLWVKAINHSRQILKVAKPEFFHPPRPVCIERLFLPHPPHPFPKGRVIVPAGELKRQRTSLYEEWWRFSASELGANPVIDAEGETPSSYHHKKMVEANVGSSLSVEVVSIIWMLSVRGIKFL